MKLLFIISMTAMLISCASPMPSAFDQGGASPQRFATDNYECERDAKSINGGDCRQMTLYESCMASKGYQAIPGTAAKGSACR